MKIERAVPEDHQVLTEITKKAKAFWGYSDKQIEAWNDDLAIIPKYIEEHETYKLELDGQFIGYYSLVRIDAATVKLDNMFVLPNCTGKGYGKKLLEDVLERVGQRNYSWIILDSDPNAENFYKRFGFEVIGQLESSVKGRFLPIMKKRVQ